MKNDLFFVAENKKTPPRDSRRRQTVRTINSPLYRYQQNHLTRLVLSYFHLCFGAGWHGVAELILSPVLDK